MTLTASSTVEIEGASAQDVLEYVLDLERYKESDHKIVKVGEVIGPDDAGKGSVDVWGKLRFGPAAPDVQNFVLERWNKLTFTGAPKQPGRMVFNFVGTFECEPTDTGVRVTHAYEFTFTLLWRWLEIPHREWLQEELDAEMDRVQDALAISSS